MDIRNREFYYNTVDLDTNKLPTTARFVKSLKPISGDLNRECAIIELKAVPSYFSSKYILIIPRDPEYSIFCDKNDSCVTLYVFDGAEYLDKTEIGLENKTDFKDIGIISFSRKWSDTI